jgi:hypothetical protein
VANIVTTRSSGARFMTGAAPSYPASRGLSLRRGGAMAGMWASVALRPHCGATAAGASARRACRVVMVPSSTWSMLEGDGPPTGGRTHGGGEGKMDNEDWGGLTVRTRDGTVLGVVVGVLAEGLLCAAQAPAQPGARRDAGPRTGHMADACAASQEGVIARLRCAGLRLFRPVTY